MNNNAKLLFRYQIVDLFEDLDDLLDDIDDINENEENICLGLLEEDIYE